MEKHKFYKTVLLKDYIYKPYTYEYLKQKVNEELILTATLYMEAINTIMKSMDKFF